MSLARAWSVGLVGVEGRLVEVEADIANGIPALLLIGRPDSSLNEARDRIRAAISNSGETWPLKRITLALSPAWLPKSGTHYDLALAAAVLAAVGAVPVGSLEERVLLGELGLDGRVHHVRGVLPAVVGAQRAGMEEVVVPLADVAEASLVPGLKVTGVRDLRGLLTLLRGEPLLEETFDADPLPEIARPDPPDLADVTGQLIARFAMEIAAAGGHHVFLHGPPGAGKTMLAERLPGLLPPLDTDAALEVTALHSLADALPPGCPLVSRAPFRNPHHSTSVPALVGGGAGIARPGEISLAHRGVLFLDEAPEFPSGLLDALRQPLESGTVTISRAGGTARYPARFTLILASNPCPCSAPGKSDLDCTCPPAARRRYQSKLSGPLLDRIDLRIRVESLPRADLLTVGAGESTRVVAERVLAARERAAHRLRGTSWRTNGDIPGQVLRRRWPPASDGYAVIANAVRTGTLSGRGTDRVLRVAWTIADLVGSERPGRAEVGQAVQLREIGR